jgi:CheY-like chemotaxis protein
METSQERPQIVLVVEDEVLVRMVISDYLRNCGYRVIEATSADEAMMILRNAEIDVDVVFSDVEMPASMDGFQYRHGCAPIVLVST